MLQVGIEAAMICVKFVWSAIISLGIIILLVILPLTLLYNLLPSLIAIIIGRFIGDEK